MNTAYIKGIFSNTKIILLITIFLSIPFFDVSPGVDKDVYRYKWDGYIFSETGNPYANTPQQLESEYADEFPFWDSMQFKEFYTVYPPISQIIFLVDHLLFGFSILSTRLIMLAFLLGSVYLIIKILELLKLPIALALTFAANPLVLYETVGTIHNDIIMVFFILASVLALFKKKFIWAVLFLALSIASKYVTLLVAPFILYYIFRKKGLVYAIKSSIILIVLLFVTYAYFIQNDTNTIFNSLEIMARTWVYSPGLFQILETYLGTESAKLFSFAVLALLYLFAIYKFPQENKKIYLLNSMLLILGWFLISSSAVFAWYVIWVAWLIPFTKNKLPWIALSLSALAATFIEADHQGLGLEKQLTLWLPFYLVFAFSMVYPIIQRKFRTRSITAE